jgi:hypothetical protein
MIRGRRRLLRGRLIAVRGVQPGLLVHLAEVLVGVHAAPARANLSLGNSAVGLRRAAAHAFILCWISLLHSDTPTRSKYAS